MSGSTTSTTSAGRLGALALTLGLAAPSAVLLAAPAAASPEVEVTPLEDACGVALSSRQARDVVVSIATADGAELQVADEGRVTLQDGAADVPAEPLESAAADQAYEVVVEVDGAAQPVVELVLPECAGGTAPSGASPSPEPSGAPSPSGAPPPSGTASAAASPEPGGTTAVQGSPEPSASPAATGSPTAASPSGSVSPSPAAATPEASASPTAASPSPSPEAPADGDSLAGRQAAATAGAPAPGAAPPAVGAGISGSVPLAGVALRVGTGPGGAGHVVAPALAQLPLTAPLAPAAAAAPVVALPPGAAGPVLAAAPPALAALLPQPPAQPAPAPAPVAAVPLTPSRSAASTSVLADALPAALLLGGLIGAHARRRLRAA